MVQPTAFHFTDVEQLLFVCTTRSRSYQRFLPPGLDWNDDTFPEGTVLVWLVHYGSSWPAADPETRIPYDELVLAVPCRHPRVGPAMYVPFLYLNQVRPLVAGRELFGYPKKLATISRERAGASHHASIRSDLGYELASLSWKAPAEAGGPAIQPPPRSVVNWRRIPAIGPVRDGRRWAVDELTVHAVAVDRLHSVSGLEVEEKSVRLLGGREDPLHEFGELTTVAGIRVRLDWSIPEPPALLETSGPHASG